MEEQRHQVNVNLDGAEMAALEAICQKECIKKPATLAGIWIRENIRQHSGVGELVAIVTEAKESGVDVEAVIRRAMRNRSRAA